MMLYQRGLQINHGNVIGQTVIAQEMEINPYAYKRSHGGLAVGTLAL